jgi:steroid delta-isomerase-like uncharacterized protein
MTIRELASAFVKAFNDHNVEALEKLLSLDFSYKDPAAPAPTGNSTDFLKLQGAIFGAFPDVNFNVNAEVIGVDGAFLSFLTTGEGRGEFAGLDINGKKIDVEEGALLQCANGRISRLEFFSDTLKLFRQMGLA